jgi:flavin reductase (DIM6/NTAB) family NADH-FMN oxidoreductase RutF
VSGLAAARCTGSVNQMSSLDVAHFKEVLGHFVTGVVVVAAIGPEGPAGFTCQTFGSLSLEPALVSFAANRAGRSWPKVHESGVVGISVLESNQEVVARVFATSGTNKFDGIGWAPSPAGAPYLEGALVHIEGRIVDANPYGDHDIVVVAVDHCVSHPGSPLMYYRSGFTVFD